MTRAAGRALLRALLRRHRRTLAVGAAAGIGWQAAAALGPLAVGRGVDALADDRPDLLVGWVAVLVGLGLLEAACAALRHRQAVTAYAETTRHLRGRLLAAVLRHDDVARSATDPGRVVSLAETDVLRTSTFLDAVAHTVGYALSVVVVAALLVRLDPALAACVLVPLALVAAVVLALRGRARALWSARQEAVSDATSTVAAGLAAHEALAGLGAGAHVCAHLRRQTDVVRRRGVAAARLEALTEPAVTLLPGLGLAAVLAVGGTRAAEGTLSLGDVVAAAGWATVLVVPVRTLAARVQTAQRALASAARLREVLEAPVRVTAPARPRPRAGVAVRLEGVAVPGLLSGVHLQLPPAGRLAVVSDDGAGAVLAALLPRLRDPDAGRVLLGGVDVRDLDLAALRRDVVLVPRHPVLTGGTVADAVRDGAHEPVDDDAVRAALRVAAADDVLVRGLDAPLGESGAGLSGGQRQRVALARALVGRPRVLVIDGAGSALDAATEAELVRRLDAHLRATGTSLLVVTGSEGLLRLADRVVRLQAGRVLSGPGDTVAAPVLLDRVRA